MFKTNLRAIICDEKIKQFKKLCNIHCYRKHKIRIKQNCILINLESKEESKPITPNKSKLPLMFPPINGKIIEHGSSFFNIHSKMDELIK